MRQSSSDIFVFSDCMRGDENIKFIFKVMWNEEFYNI